MRFILIALTALAVAIVAAAPASSAPAGGYCVTPTDPPNNPQFPPALILVGETFQVFAEGLPQQPNKKFNLSITDPSGNTSVVFLGPLAHDPGGDFVISTSGDEAGTWTYQFTDAKKTSLIWATCTAQVT